MLSGEHEAMIYNFDPAKKSVGTYVVCFKTPIPFSYGWLPMDNKQSGKDVYPEIDPAKRITSLLITLSGGVIFGDGMLEAFQHPSGKELTQRVLEATSFRCMQRIAQGEDAILLDYDYSYALEKMGFKPDRDGFNCISDPLGHVIPLSRRPRDREWSDPIFENVLGLQAIEGRFWRAVVRYLVGMKVESIQSEDTVNPFTSIAPEGSEDSDENLEEHELELGECFKITPKEGGSLFIFGKYFVFKVIRSKSEIWLVDSPFYGIGLNFFSSSEAAIGYVKLPAGRVLLKESDVYHGRINHTTDWWDRAQKKLNKLSAKLNE